MANTFKSYLASATGTSDATVVTVAANTQTVAVGINLANILTSQIKASVYITREVSVSTINLVPIMTCIIIK